MKQKPIRTLLNRYTAGMLVVLVAVATSAVILLQHNHTDATPAVKPAVGAAVPSQFSFSGTSGWFQGATNETSMALFKTTHDCFTSIEHDNGTVDVATTLQKEQDTLTSGGYTVASDGTQTLTLQTAAGPQQYQLYQYTVTSPAGASTVEGGQEFGYVQLSNSYLKIEGYCDTTSELPATIPTLSAIKFDDAH